MTCRLLSAIEGMLEAVVVSSPCVRLATPRLGAEVFIFGGSTCADVFWHVKVKIEVTQVQVQPASVRAEPSAAARALGLSGAEPHVTLPAIRARVGFNNAKHKKSIIRQQEHAMVCLNSLSRVTHW